MLSDGRTDGWTDRRTDRRKVITIAHPEHSSGELISLSEKWFMSFWKGVVNYLSLERGDIINGFLLMI